MGTFDTQTPRRLQLAEWEKAARRVAVEATGSAAPAEYEPIAPPSPAFTHIGHAAQYGRGRRNGRTVRLLILHVTDVNGTLLGAMSFEARRGGVNPDTGAPTDMVSCHAFAGPEGELGACVPPADRAFTTGRWNDESEALEIIGHDEWTAEQWRARPKQMEAIVVWLVDRCRANRIPPRWLWRADIAKGASRHGQTPVQGTEYGICDHLEANLAAKDLGQTSGTGHVCVGPGLREVLFEDLLPEAVRRLAGPPITPPIIPGDAMYHVIDPSKSRVLDTRKPTRSNAGGNEGKPLGRVTVHAHRAGLPDGTVAVAVNLAAAEPGGGGFLTAWPSGTMPDTSCVNYSTPGDTRSGFTIVGLSGFGTFELAAGGASAHAVVDIVGAFTR